MYFVKVWLLYQIQFVIYFLECFMFIALQFSRRDDLQNTGIDAIWGLKIVELFGSLFLKLRDGKRKVAFHTITDFTSLHVLSFN